MKITLEADWTYRTPSVTIDYAAGDHDVSEEIADAARAAGIVKEKADGDGGAATGAAGDTGDVKG